MNSDRSQISGLLNNRCKQPSLIAPEPSDCDLDCENCVGYCEDRIEDKN